LKLHHVISANDVTAGDNNATNTDENAAPTALRLPGNKLWFGYDVKPFNAEQTDGNGEGGNPSQPPTTSGPGRTLRG
jgi:hypothetical protein